MSNLVVQTNVLALNSHRNLTVIGAKQATASARLSSGYRINSAADDAAGLAISEKMRSQVRGLDMASKNAQDASSLIQTAEGGMNEIDNMVQRIRELVVYASNDTQNQSTQADGTGDRRKIQDEINQLTQEIDSMSNRVEFNGKKLIDGTWASVTYDVATASVTAGGSTTISAVVTSTAVAGASGLYFQIGANAGQGMTLYIGSVSASGLGIAGANGSSIINVMGTTGSGQTGSTAGTGVIAGVDPGLTDMLARLDGALTIVTTERSKLGAVQNRLEYTKSSLDISSENLSAAESRIRDTDMAKEMMALTAANVLQQAGVSMLSQANQAPQSVLQLLR